jgi:hypothetical protein
MKLNEIIANNHATRRKMWFCSLLSESKVAASDIPENTVLQDLEQEPRWRLEQYHLPRLSPPPVNQPSASAPLNPTKFSQFQKCAAVR